MATIYQTESLIGKRFEELLVESSVPSQGNGRLWSCRCTCGQYRVVSTGHLNKGLAKSCGCKPRKTGSANHRWKGFGDIPMRYWGQLCHRAKAFNRELGISIEDAWRVFCNQEGRCALSGVVLSFRDRTASLDRIDSEKGYVIGNVQWVHKDINEMKMDQSQDKFLDWISKIYQNQNK